jgi:hypothetical protein
MQKIFTALFTWYGGNGLLLEQLVDSWHWIFVFGTKLLLKFILSLWNGRWVVAVQSLFVLDKVLSCHDDFAFWAMPLGREELILLLHPVHLMVKRIQLGWHEQVPADAVLLFVYQAMQINGCLVRRDLCLPHLILGKLLVRLNAFLQKVSYMWRFSLVPLTAKRHEVIVLKSSILVT